MTAALLLVAAMLWFNLGQRPSAPSPTTAQTPLWPSELTAPITLNQTLQPNMAPLEDLSIFRWSAKKIPQVVPATPEPATPTAAVASAPGAAQSTTPKADLTDAVAKSPMPAGHDEAPVAATQPSSRSEQPVTPTPNSTDYPSTPFATFDFESLRHALDSPKPPAYSAIPTDAAIGNAAVAPTSR